MLHDVLVWLGCAGNFEADFQKSLRSLFELLRARVTRDNQVPVVLQRRTDRDLAFLRLKQLLNLPYRESLQLTSDINEPADVREARNASNTGSALDASIDTSTSSRAPVRQLDEALKAQEAQLTIARREWLPTISVTSAYSRVAFGAGGVPAWGNWLNNWNRSNFRQLKTVKYTEALR